VLVVISIRAPKQQVLVIHLYFCPLPCSLLSMNHLLSLYVFRPLTIKINQFKKNQIFSSYFIGNDMLTSQRPMLMSSYRVQEISIMHEKCLNLLTSRQLPWLRPSQRFSPEEKKK
jgi:hypothetical protein